MPVDVHIPLRLRVDEPALSQRADALDAALVSALGRALANSRAQVLAERGGYVDVVTHPPTFTWLGDGLAQVSPALRAQTEARLIQRINECIEAADLQRYVRAGRREAPPVMPPITGVSDKEHYSRLAGLYMLPSYQHKGERKPVAVQSDDEVDDADYVTVYSLEQIPIEQFTQRLAQMITDRWDELEGLGLTLNPERNRIIAGRLGGICQLDSGDYYVSAFEFKGMKVEELFFASFPLPFDLDVDPSGNKLAQSTVGLPGNGIYHVSWGGKTPSDVAGWTEFLLKMFVLNLDKKLPQLKIPPGLTASEYRESVLDNARPKLEALAKSMAAQGSIGFLSLTAPNGRRINLHTKHDLSASIPGTIPLLPIAVAAQVLRSDLSDDLDAAGGGGGGKDAAGGKGGKGAAGGKGGKGGAGKGGKGGKGGTGAGAEAKKGGTGTGTDGGTGAESAAEVGGSPVYTGAEPTDAPTAPGVYYPPSYYVIYGGENCSPLLGEPPLDDLGEDSAGLRQTMEVIANLLNISPCGHIGRFCLNAAAAIGARSAQVAAYGARDTGFVEPTVRGSAGNLGSINFQPLPSAAIQYMRFLGGLVPRVHDLAEQAIRVISQPANIRRLDSAWHDDPVGFALHFYIEFSPTMDQAVSTLFGMTCQIVMLQLLETSHQAIQTRIDSFNQYAAQFEAVIYPQLQTLDSLIQLRERLRLFQTARTVQSTVNKVDPYGLLTNNPAFVMTNWMQATRGLTDVLLAANQAPSAERGERGQIVIRDGQVFIFDERGQLWSLEQLESMITMRRGLLESIDPLIKQLTELDDVMANFRNPNVGVRLELWRILNEMKWHNERIMGEARDSWLYAVRASKIREGLAGTQIPNCGFVLQGVHKLVHEQIGEFFHGDPFYGRGVDYLLSVELGRQKLMAFFEFTGILLLSVLCPPLGVAAGMVTALYHYAEAEEREELYHALIDPELVLTWAEVEVEMFAAGLGVALAFLPEVGSILGKGASAAVRLGARESLTVATEALETTVRTGVRGAARRLTVHLTEAVLEQIERGLIREFVHQLITTEALNLVMERVMTPVIQAYEREVLITGAVGGLEGAQSIQQQLRPDQEQKP